jgi:hypothetical protein
MDSMNSARGERRRHSRRGNCVSHGLKISSYRPLHAHWVAVARVVDFSSGGVGVEMFEPLIVGAVVSASGELHSTDWCISLTGQARVTSCQGIEGAAFRIGFEFEDGSYRPLVCDHGQEAMPPAPALMG